MEINMYEPIYLPIFRNHIHTSNIRFAVRHNDSYICCDDPNADPLHIHDSLEIFFNISSDISFLVNNNLYPLNPGSAVVSRPGDIHIGMFHKNAVHKYVCLWIDADFTSPLFSFLHSDNFHPLFSFDEQTKTQLFSLVFSLLDIDGKDDSELEQLCCLLQILTLLKNKSTNNVQQEFFPAPLQNILDDINENYFRICNVNDILNSHFISSATLTRWFRKYLHTTPREYLESVRLFNAARLLSNGLSVTETCMRSGFSDCSHFIVLFKKKFGETPLQYKKNSKFR